MKKTVFVLETTIDTNHVSDKRKAVVKNMIVPLGTLDWENTIQEVLISSVGT